MGEQMKQESRVKKSILNARVNLIFYFLTLVLSFFSRKVFLDSLGADFIGLTGSIGSLLGLLNLAELGIGSAIGYVLYKPIFEQNKEKINEIISVFGYFYRWVGLVILIFGCILSLFLPRIFPDVEFGFGIIYFTYYSFLFSSLIGYFVNYRQTLLGADQKNYVVTAYFQTANICKTLIQLALAYYWSNYYYWVLIEFIFGVLYAIILNWKINQVYPWLKSDVKNGRFLKIKYPEVITYTKQLFVHKIGEVTLSQVTNFLVYAFGSLQSVAYYGNYTLITSKISVLVGNFLGSTTAGIGNLIAEGNKEKILKVYWELTAINFFIAGICSIALYKLIPPFISLWLGPQYLMSDRILLLVVIAFSLSLIRNSTSQFKYGYGLFSDVWSPIAESLILVIVAVVGGKLWGLDGVLLGGVASTIVIIFGWQAYFLFSRGFKAKIWSYLYNYTKNACVLFASYYLTKMVLSSSSIDDITISWWALILYAVKLVGLYSFISFVLMVIFVPGMRFFIKRLLKI